ncbi:hypothetical protein ASG90_08205 [Nocardioides sp. Soil797]|nr:hypothetical protein ASG90_08205 [Nocardioides sp. Soil797]
MPQLEILHWNDVHGRYAELARLSARARRIRAGGEHPVLLLDGGDIEDTSVELSALTQGVAGWRLLRAAGVDASVVGNGGLLRYGPQALPGYAEAFGRAPLVCDLSDQDGQQPHGTMPSTLLTAGDLVVGVIGATDFYPQYTEGFDLVERGRVTAVRKEATALRAAGADVVVLLSHCGEDADANLSWHLKGSVDLVVGGHTHDPFPDGRRDRGIPMAHAGCHGQYLGRVMLRVEAGEVTVESMVLEKNVDDVAGDPAVLAELEAAEADLATWLDEPVGTLEAAVPLGTGSDSPVARLMVRALMERFPADVGVLICAHMSAGLPQGMVRRRDLYAATSSPGNAATGTIDGHRLARMLETGASNEYAARTPRTFRGRPYGGLAVVGAALRDGVAHIGDVPVDPEATYRITASDLELAHYGGLIPQSIEDVEWDISRILPEVLEAHFTS